MIGHNVISEFTERADHLTTIKAKTDGLIAVIPSAEIKIEMRRAPDAVSPTIQITVFQMCKIMQVIANYSMQTLYYNVHGVEMNPKVHHIENG